MKKNRRVFQAFTMIIQFSLNMLVPIFLCTMLGVWLGNKYQIKVIAVPLFLIGALAGFRNIFVMAKQIYDGKDTESKPEYKTGQGYKKED